MGEVVLIGELLVNHGGTGKLEGPGDWGREADHVEDREGKSIIECKGRGKLAPLGETNSDQPVELQS